jgi:isopenicillin N synthase-like dioxygenase
MEAVPVIDADALDAAAMRAEMDRACRDWGFFQLVGHGIDPALVAALQAEMRAFFALPLASKLRVERTLENPWGFFDRELTKNARDQKQIFDVGPANDEIHPTPWPAPSPDFRPTVEAYMEACEDLAFRVLGSIEGNLGMPVGHLATEFRPRNSSFLRLNYYPAEGSADASADGAFGVHHHTDAGALTLLLQDEEPGLEVHHEGRWSLVEPRADAIVVNIGDIVQVWSNDRYRAALHRVRASRARPRYSVPFFFNPSNDCCYAPLETTVSEAAPALYRPIHWREFRTLRAAGDYVDRGEEVQIDCYRIARPGCAEDDRSHGLH